VSTEALNTLACANKTALDMAERMKAAYLKSVARSLEYYDNVCVPDEDDFLAWVEGYDWSKE
jgi:hypothetical protein